MQDTMDRGFTNVVLSAIHTEDLTAVSAPPSTTPESSECSSSTKPCCVTATHTPTRLISNSDDSLYTAQASTNRHFTLPAGHSLKNYVIYYIGSTSSLTLTNLCISYSTTPVYTYDPSTRQGRTESVAVNKVLMRRYYLVQQAKDADIIGIVVGTLGIGKLFFSILIFGEHSN